MSDVAIFAFNPMKENLQKVNLELTKSIEDEEQQTNTLKEMMKGQICRAFSSGNCLEKGFRVLNFFGGVEAAFRTPSHHNPTGN